ncbi:type II toxin-antitoxin system mRNA interferase toxin, RelE/StbE family [Bacteriovorax sp. PP10]|uniref:Type II toxin-antitoxin system mRNA interferase toxin, RelE/StbE family n=1 Tax=Bacteriovorax antarcticus TaxID=3088717 RepID=A0ABU5VVQ3_9BACT|nr:type II toxin-antitoxin system mRNA interferase toxin, RelE/StbE family [Bacteriovorax sp. PP10]MEA9357127.1 type II toxin-antitoxin system mRNA interferase toxin, RelE/StbE family [Bacteriovorax sp. PP10]
MEIIYTKKAVKNIEKLPKHIQAKMFFWLDLIDDVGPVMSRKYPGFNDEALHGKRKGQRSVRLSKGYRLFYQELPCEYAVLIEILEVNKHDY